MRSDKTQGTNGCANCGGQLQYNYTFNTDKCLYCGSEFKIDHSGEENYEEVPYTQTIFVETVVNVPEEPRKVRNNVFSSTPKPDIRKLRQTMLWGLGVWAGWSIVSLIIAGIIMAATNTNTMPNNLLTSKLFGFYWCLRGIIFCLVWPSLRANGFFKRKNSF